MCMYVHVFVGGYDSDVEREKAMDYGSKIYSDPIRDPGKLKPQQQPQGEAQRAKVSRSTSATSKVVTTEEKTKVDVSIVCTYGRARNKDFVILCFHGKFPIYIRTSQCPSKRHHFGQK